MAMGKNKAKAIKNMVTGPLSAACPASYLQLHDNAIVLLDKDAASELEEQDYYVWLDQ